MDTKPLDALIKAFNQENAVGLIGVLGSKTNRRGTKVLDGPTNAEIGAKHEFGDDNLPIRSWLRMPLTEHMQTALESHGAFDPAVSKKVVKQKSIVPWLKKVMIIAEYVVIEAFASGGFGKWKPSNMKYKKNHQTLVETQQLMRSITSEVKE